MQYDRQEEPEETRVQVIDRIRRELYSVEDRVEALSLYLDTDEPLSLSDNEYNLLDMGLKCLKAYEFVLAERLEATEQEEDDIIYLTNII